MKQTSNYKIWNISSQWQETKNLSLSWWCKERKYHSGADLNSWTVFTMKDLVWRWAIKNYTFITNSEENIHNSIDWVQGVQWTNPELFFFSTAKPMKHTA